MIILDYRDRRPIYEQIVERFQELMMSGAMEENSQLPSVRSLAMDLSINPNTIQRAYAELERQGYLYVVKGRGNFVADSSGLLDERKEEMKQKVIYLYREGRELGMTKTDFIECLQGIEE